MMRFDTLLNVRRDRRGFSDFLIRRRVRLFHIFDFTFTIPILFLPLHNQYFGVARN